MGTTVVEEWPKLMRYPERHLLTGPFYKMADAVLFLNTLKHVCRQMMKYDNNQPARGWHDAKTRNGVSNMQPHHSIVRCKVNEPAYDGEGFQHVFGRSM